MSSRSFRHLDSITVAFVTVLLISNLASTKIIDLKIFTFDGGTLFFPLTYICGDILTEVYGYARSRRVIWLGFAAALLLALTCQIIALLPADPEWTAQAAFETILGQTPRIVLASLIAYTIGEFLNSFILAKLKILTRGRFLWVRTIGSTLIGEGADTLLFVLIAFAGMYSTPLLMTIVISNYIFKVGIEVIFTPLTYLVVNWLKRKEGADYYDYQTNFNPLRW